MPLPQRAPRPLTVTLETSAHRATTLTSKEARIHKATPNLLVPPPSAEALADASRQRAESDGFTQFGRRTWFLVKRGGEFRAVETLDDAPGWSLVKEMKR